MTETFIPDSPDDFPDPAVLAGLKGIDVMRGVLAGRFPAAPISRLANMEMVEVAEGRVTFRAVPEFRHYNPLGTVHGGWYGILLDSAMACAVVTALPRGKGYTTLEYKVNLLRAATADTGPLTCTGTVLHAGRRTATAEGRMEDADGRLYATGTTTCLVMDLG